MAYGIHLLHTDTSPTKLPPVREKGNQHHITRLSAATLLIYRCRQYALFSFTMDLVVKCENTEFLFLEPEVVTNVTIQMIKRETQVDPVLPKVYSFVISGWPIVVDLTFVPFKIKRDEFTTQQGCILWGTRVVIPSALQEKVLHVLHETHPGISRNKALARSYIWWPNIDSYIERTTVLRAALANP